MQLAEWRCMMSRPAFAHEPPNLRKALDERFGPLALTHQARVDAARDLKAEEWLLARHRSDWTLGNATQVEWDEAYAAVDRNDAERNG